MLKADRNKRQNKVAFHCCAGCAFKLSFELSTKKQPGDKWQHNFSPHKDHCVGVQAGKQKNHTATSSHLSPVLHDLTRSNTEVTEEAACKLLQPYLHSSPSKSFIQRAKKCAEEDLYGLEDEQARLIMAIKVAYEKKGHTVNVWEAHGKESQQEIIREQHKKLHKKAHINHCKKEGIEKGDPRARYKYVEPDNLFECLDEYEDNDTFQYGYDIIFKHARPMAPKLKTVFSADGAHLKGEHTGTTFGMWGQDANKHVICMCLSVYFDNESSDTWHRFLSAVKMNIPSMDAEDKVVIAGKIACRI